jgi:hypothetical protein
MRKQQAAAGVSLALCRRRVTLLTRRPRAGGAECTALLTLWAELRAA